MDWELWGTFSVGDHLRRRAFVADVLLYDRLVVPTPPVDDELEEKRWRHLGWMPDRQRRILNVMGADVIVEVPWTEWHRRQWEQMYQDARGLDKANVRSGLADAAAADVSDSIARRTEFETRGGRPDEVDQLAHFTSRRLLVDWTDMKRDTNLFMGLPRVTVDAVAAYGSYHAFRKDHPEDRVVTNHSRAETLLHCFGWEFLVPGDSRRSDEDLLKQAVELAHLDQTRRYRYEFHRWRRDILEAGKSPREAVAAMNDAIDSYRTAVRKTKITTTISNAFRVSTVGAPVLGLAVPPLALPMGAVATLSGLGHMMFSDVLKQEVPERLKVAAMFHDARKRFGWH